MRPFEWGTMALSPAVKVKQEVLDVGYKEDEVSNRYQRKRLR